MFPDSVPLSEFILTQKISRAEVNSSTFSMEAYLTDKQIVIACNQFKAIFQVIQAIE